MFASKTFKMVRNPSSWGNKSEVNERAWPSRNLGTAAFLEGGAGESTGDAKDNKGLA